MSWINAEDIPEDEFSDLSETSSQSQFRFENIDDDSEYLPSSFDPSSQEYSQVIIQNWISEHVVKDVIGSLFKKDL